MYNPASIVDLRRNSSFTLISTPTATRNAIIAVNPKVERSTSSGIAVPSPGMSDAQTPISGIRMNESSLFHIPQVSIPHIGAHQTCRSCDELTHRVRALEARLSANEMRFSKFEEQMLSVLRGISGDLRDLKLGRETPPAGSNASRFTPPPLDLESLRRTTEKISVNPRQNISTTPELEYTRDAIAGACVALERLVADARTRSYA